MMQFRGYQAIFSLLSTYQRGQAVSIGRMLGYEDAPMTDYNFYNMVALKRGVEE